VLLHLVDGTAEDVAGAYRTIRRELEAYDAGLPDKQEIVALNKCDALDDETIEARAAALAAVSGRQVFTLSGVTGSGVTPILRALLAAIDHDRSKAALAAEEAERSAKAWTP
jgi:GTP-binding protein